jgi:hypothetical protein
MTDEKICPFMSRPYISCISGKDECGTRSQYTDVEYVGCQKERCMAWGSKILYTETNTGAVVKSDGCRLIP